MRSPATNQRRSTRNRRNTRNRRDSTNQRTVLDFTPKLKYSESSTNDNGVFMLTKRKRPSPTAEEVEAKKMRLLQINQRKYFVVALRHKVTNMWLYGVNFNEWQFAADNTTKIIECLQVTYPKYEKKAVAKSFVYRAIKRLKDADPMPSAECRSVPRFAGRRQAES